MNEATKQKTIIPENNKSEKEKPELVPPVPEATIPIAISGGDKVLHKHSNYMAVRIRTHTLELYRR